MTYQEFDQTTGQGWRVRAQQSDFTGAAEAIEAFLHINTDLEPWQIEILHFHAAQMHAFAGKIDKALEHLPLSRKDEQEYYPVRWNDYVDATEAFLRGDLAGLQAARGRVALGSVIEPYGIPNLAVVDRLIANFGKPYSEAYG